MLCIIASCPCDCGLDVSLRVLIFIPCECGRRSDGFGPNVSLDCRFRMAEQPTHPLVIFQDLAFTQTDFALSFEFDDGLASLLFVNAFRERSIDPQYRFLCGSTHTPLIDFDAAHQGDGFVGALFLFRPLAGEDVHIELRIAERQSDLGGRRSVREKNESRKENHENDRARKHEACRTRVRKS